MAAVASDTRLVSQAELKTSESWCDKTRPVPSPVSLLHAGSFATDSDDHDRQQQVRIVALGLGSKHTAVVLLPAR